MLAGYRVIKLLGRGGMGEVWAAAKPDEQEQVAIKVLLPNAAVQPALVARFEREAKVSAAIQSEYVCRLLDAQRDEGGAHLLIFEKLEGESLSQRLKRETYLPFAEVGPIVDDTLQGLHAAHSVGVIHRDLKPANLFLEWTGEASKPERAKILDFGISKLTRKKGGGRDEPSLTDFDATLGSFAYMAPEQVRGAARADCRADIYALGVVAFRALAGRLPFTANNAGMLIALKLDRAAPSLSEITDEHWPAGLERFLARALRRDPAARHGSADEALAEWRACLPGNLARRNQPPPKSVAGEAPVDGQSQTAVTLGESASFATEIDISYDPTE
jgi:eukaryotic-like serine/threonine-protein kinase